MDIKECSICKEVKPLNDFYSQKKKPKDSDEWIYYNPECKECTKKRTYKWRENNPEVYKVHYDKRNRTTEQRKRVYLHSKRRSETKEHRKWQRQNKDRIKIYIINRQNKIHEFSAEEWESCKKFFDHSCAYCGMSEELHKEVHKQQLHKEHVEHNGSNGIDNCVPACRPCNSSKRTYSLNEWYLKQDFFDTNKLNKICEWLETHKNFTM